MNATERYCFIHIGTHKTGTTSIQAFLGMNRERFSAAGVYFPSAGSDCDEDYIAHHQLANELNDTSRFDPARGGLDAVAVQLRQSSARVACLSSEDLSFLWNNPSALVSLRDAVVQSGFVPRIVVYLRPQASYCTAVYAQTVGNGYRTDFATFLTDILADGHYRWGSGIGPPFEYHKLLEPFAEVFGQTSIIARRYSSSAPDNALLFDFARLLLPLGTDFADFAIPRQRENGSRDFTSVLEYIGSRAVPAERIRFTPLSVWQTLRFERRFHKSNREIASRYGVKMRAFEPLDIALALPIRRTVSKTRALVAARRALAQIETRRC